MNTLKNSRRPARLEVVAKRLAVAITPEEQGKLDAIERQHLALEEKLGENHPHQAHRDLVNARAAYAAAPTAANEKEIRRLVQHVSERENIFKAAKLALDEQSIRALLPVAIPIFERVVTALGKLVAEIEEHEKDWCATCGLPFEGSNCYHGCLELRERLEDRLRLFKAGKVFGATRPSALLAGLFTPSPE